MILLELLLDTALLEVLTIKELDEVELDELLDITLEVVDSIELSVELLDEVELDELLDVVDATEELLELLDNELSALATPHTKTNTNINPNNFMLFFIVSFYSNIFIFPTD